jgi:pilus assembly protein CpaB
MNRNKMAMALCIALVVSGLCTALLARQIGAKKRSQDKEHTFVAMAKSVEAGTVVKPEDVKMIPWPANVPLAGGFTSTADVVGRTALENLAQDAPVLNQDLAAKGAGVGLSVKIPDGMRAISLKSDEVVGVSGFVFPGSRVDVLVTFRNPNSSDTVTATVLQNVQVLAAGNKVAPDPTGVATNVNEVTLLLSPGDAEKAVLASSQGTIHFVLRNGSDNGADTTTPVEMSNLDGGAPKVAATPVTKVTHAPIHKAASQLMVKTTGIETVMGDKTATATF